MLVNNIRSLAASVATVEGDGRADEMATQLPAVRQRGFQGALLFFAATCSQLDTAHSQAIHAHFKEWLARTGNLGQINDLLHFDLDAAKARKTGATSPYSAPPVTPTKPVR